MAISRSDMLCFISHVLDERYEVAFRQLQSMMSTSDPGRQCSIRRETLAMIGAVAANCFKTMTEKPAEGKLSLLKFLTSCYALTGDEETELVMKYEVLTVLDSMGANSLENWISFARDCVHCGYLANAIKAFEKITSCSRVRVGLKFRSSGDSEDRNGRRRLLAEAAQEKDIAMRLVNRHSVQVRAMELLRRQTREKEVSSEYSLATGSDRYLLGIKRRNLHRLENSQMKQSHESSSESPKRYKTL